VQCTYSGLGLAGGGIGPFLIAYDAIADAFFALAQNLRKRENAPAFTGILS
jgi:hypothetical protein